jgi:putative ATP-binding cassette transporter
MLLGTLRDQLIYPNPRNGMPDEKIYAALERVNLEDLPDRLGGLNVEKDWPTGLAQGEQQRITFARILLNEPRYVMLDEATSALDVKNERHLYDILQDLDLVYISVGHRPSLVDYHKTVLELTTQSNWKVMQADEYQFMAN